MSNEKAMTKINDPALVQQIRDLITSGATGKYDIARKVNIQVSTLRKLCTQNDILLPSGRPGRSKGKKCAKDKTPSPIAALLKEGSSIDDICKQLGIDCLPQRDYEFLYWAEQNVSMAEIGRAYNYSRERVRQIIASYGTTIEKIGQKSRERAKEPNYILLTQRSSLLDVLSARQEQLWDQKRAEHPWAAQKTKEYYDSLQRIVSTSSKNLDRVFTLFKAYYNVQNDSQKKGLRYYSALTGFFPYTISVIFHAVGIKPMYGNQSKIRDIQNKALLSCIKRALTHNLGAADIAYFTNKPYPAITQKMIYHHLSFPHNANRILIPRDTKRGHKTAKIPLHLISEVFEANDANFSLEETCTLLENYVPFGKLMPSDIAYIIEHQETIIPTITKILSEVYGYPVRKPYERFKFSNKR